MVVRRVRASVTATLLLAAVMMVGAVPAGATVVERGHESDDFSFSHDDCGFEIVVEGTFEVRYRIRAGTGSLDGAFFVRENFALTETHTNPATGASFTVTGKGVFNEVRARHVEGNVFEFWAVEAGQPFVVYDSDGNLVLRDRGALRHHILFDTLGDDRPGGVVVADLGTQVHGPHPGWETDADYCEFATSLIGA